MINIDDVWFEFSPEKNTLLKETRGISFDDIIALIEAGQLVGIKKHPNPLKYPNQYILEVEEEDYVYCVPCVINDKQLFLKTVYPSRQATKARRKGQGNDQE